MYVEESVVINQPVEKVFDYVSNPVNFPEWAGPVVEVRGLQQTAPGELREGDKYTLVSKFLGRQFESPSEVTAYEPNRRFSSRVTGGPIPDQRSGSTPSRRRREERVCLRVRRASREASSSWPVHFLKEHSSDNLETT